MNKLLPALVVVFLFLTVILGIRVYSLGKILPPNQNTTEIPFIVKNLDEDVLWSVVNEWRSNQGLKKYIKNDLLCDIANERLKTIEEDFSHDKWKETFERFSKNRLSYGGENLANVSDGEESTLNSWLQSPSHYKNLRYDFKYSCIETDGTYAVQIFGNF